MVVLVQRIANCASGEAHLGGLLDPDHICEKLPTLWIFNRFLRSDLPDNWAIFLKGANNG